MSLLEIASLSHSYGDNQLYKNANFSLNKGEHIGIVGQNGTGKSTLIKICTEQVIPDSGYVMWQPKVSFGYLDQYAKIDYQMTIEGFLKAAFYNLFQIEKELSKHYERLAAGDKKECNIAAGLQEILEKRDFYTIDTQIAQVASGLGLSALGLERPIEKLSGGQRAKVILAKLLLEKPDILLLDEPTNFLDKENIEWLKKYLTSFENAFMVISHDYDFLDKVTNRIIDIDNKKTTKYYGTYEEFLKKKMLLREDYIRRYSAQQKDVKKTEEFIRRNIAGRKSKMARGRKKQLARMDKMDILEEKEIKPNFKFQELPLTNSQHLLVEHLTVGYYYPVLSNINFAIKGGQKVVLAGFNGIGKSTLLKTLINQLSALQGKVTFSQQVVLGYFEQDLFWENKTMTPIEIISNAYPALSNKEIRKQLARSGVSNKQAMQMIDSLSGGEQSKVKICMLTINPCNFLIMDEPTNHLDIQSKNALKNALMSFSGTVILVSHEEAFYKDWAQRVIYMEDVKQS